MLLSQILVYPIKSLDGVAVKEARMTSGGILEFDRIYAMVDESGAYVNGKRTSRVQLLRSTFDPQFREVSIWQMAIPSATISPWRAIRAQQMAERFFWIRRKTRFGSKERVSR